MIQETESQGWEGGLAPADRMALNQSGGKPAFLTLRFWGLSYLSQLNVSVAI